MNNKQQDLYVIYGVVRAAREALNAAHGRTVLSTRADVSNRIEDLSESMRKLCSDLARELDL